MKNEKLKITPNKFPRNYTGQAMKNLKLTKVKTLGLVILLFLLGTNFALALENKYPVLPGVPGTTYTKLHLQDIEVGGKIIKGIASKGDLVGFILYIFVFGLIISGLAALAMFIWAGAQWLTSVGNPQKQSDAKDRITGAVLGVLLLMGSYILLAAINPDITRLGFGGPREFGNMVYCYTRSSDNSIWCYGKKADCSSVAKSGGVERRCGTGAVKDLWCDGRGVKEGPWICEKRPAGGGVETCAYPKENCLPKLGSFYVEIPVPKFVLSDTTPVTAGVRLYNDNDFIGAKTIDILVSKSDLSGISTYEPKDGKYPESPNDKFIEGKFKPSSIKVAPSYGTVLFEEKNYNTAGPDFQPENGLNKMCLFTYSDMREMGFFNDQALSLLVFTPEEKFTIQPNEIILYQNSKKDKEKGWDYEITGTGSLYSFNLPLDKLYNDQATSISISEQYLVLLFDDLEKKKRCNAFFGPGVFNIAKQIQTAGESDWVSSLQIIKLK